MSCACTRSYLFYENFLISVKKKKDSVPRESQSSSFGSCTSPSSMSDPSAAKARGNLLHTPTAKGQQHELVAGSVPSVVS